jgi:hypothetical protein
MRSALAIWWREVVSRGCLPSSDNAASIRSSRRAIPFSYNTIIIHRSVTSEEEINTTCCCPITLALVFTLLFGTNPGFYVLFFSKNHHVFRIFTRHSPRPLAGNAFLHIFPKQRMDAGSIPSGIPGDVFLKSSLNFLMSQAVSRVCR